MSREELQGSTVDLTNNKAVNVKISPRKSPRKVGKNQMTGQNKGNKKSPMKQMKRKRPGDSRWNDKNTTSPVASTSKSFDTENSFNKTNIKNVVPQKFFPSPGKTKAANDYHESLGEYLALRKSAGFADPGEDITGGDFPSTSTSVPPETLKTLNMFVPSEELIWTRDSGEQQKLAPISPTRNSVIPIEDEIEEGEIVEREVDEIVDLLSQSMKAVEGSRKSNVFFEDRSAAGFGEVPLYNTINDPQKLDSSDEVILLDSSHPGDDSVIFVGEDKNSATPKAMLQRPDFLKTPAISNLMNLASKTKNKNTKLKKNRLKRLRAKLGQVEVIEIEDDCIEMEGTSETQKPSTSADQQTPTVQINTSPVGSSAMVVPSATAVSSATAVPSSEPQKRIILIDGSNVAMQFKEGPRNGGKEFAVEGLKICIEYFESKGFQVKAIVPEYRMKRDQSTNQNLLHSLKDKGYLSLTPRMSYDDRVLLEAAHRLDAAVVSNDFFRDLVQEKPEFKDIVNSRLIRFNWLFGQLIIPEDPYGRNGPKLDDILYKRISSNQTC